MNVGKDQQKNEVSYVRTTSRTRLINYQSEKEFSIQPIKEGGSDPKFAAHNAHPGPAQPKEMPQKEGSKEDRMAAKEALNK